MVIVVCLFLNFSYFKSTGSTNFRKHVEKYHNKEFKAMNKTKEQKLVKINEALKAKPKSKEGSNIISQKKLIWGRKLALWVAESLIPAEVAVSNGTLRFLQPCHIDVSSFPTERTILTSALDDVYLSALIAVKEHIKNNCPNVVSISTDMWTDSHIGLSYVNYNLIYFDKKRIIWKQYSLKHLHLKIRRQEQICHRT